jgi:PiT family inorganic phosphate transporter
MNVIIIHDPSILLMMAIFFGFMMAWGVGANDVANAMGTSVGAKVLTIRHAIILAAIFEVLGALLASDAVTTTISRGLVDFANVPYADLMIVFGMIASLAAAAVWLLVATLFGWPVSTTHCIIGAIMGFGCYVAGPEYVHWDILTSIVASWIFTPLIAALISAMIFYSISTLIINRPEPVVYAKRYVPVYFFFVSWVIVQMAFSQGIAFLGLHWHFWSAMSWVLLISLCLTGLGYFKIRKFEERVLTNHKDYLLAYRDVETMFGVLAIFTASAMAFAHGGNDVANAIGPLSRVVTILNNASLHEYPRWVTILGAFGVVTGLSMYGYKIIETVGTKITALTPIRGFSAQFATAFTVIAATVMGLPVSTTHTLVGAVLGVGVMGGIGAIDLRVVRGIFSSWFVTLPAGAILSILFFEALKAFFLPV